MIIKNNSRTGLRSLGMTEMIPHVTPTRKTFVGPLLEEALKLDSSTPQEAGSLPSLRLIKCPRAIGRASGVFYDVPLALLGETDLIHAGQRVRYDLLDNFSQKKKRTYKGLERLFEPPKKTS